MEREVEIVRKRRLDREKEKEKMQGTFKIIRNQNEGISKSRLRKLRRLA